QKPGAQFRYRAASAGQTLIASLDVTGGAGIFVEMDTKAFFEGIHRFECGACLIELFGWEKTVLRCETPWRLLRPSICAQRHKNDGEDSKRFNKRIDHVYLQSKRGERLALQGIPAHHAIRKSSIGKYAPTVVETCTTLAASSPHSTRKP